MRHIVQVPMRWSDMDAYGHINNVVFLQYFEMARIDLLFELITLEEHTGLRRGAVVGSHDIRYRRPVVFTPRPLNVHVWISDIRSASFRCQYELFDHDNLAVSGSSQLVTYDFALARPRRLTPEENKFLRCWLDCDD